MILNPRPSKIRFYTLFPRLITEAEPFGSVLDLACAHGKNRHFFCGKHYLGVDLEPQLICRAGAELADKQTSFLTGDLMDPQEPLASMRFDLVVSTHTLSHIPTELKSRAFGNLTDLVAPGGSLLLECQKAELPLIQAHEAEFESCRTQSYRGAFSRAWERLLSKAFSTGAVGDLTAGRAKGLLRRPLLAVSYLLSLLDGWPQPDSILCLLKGKKAL